MIIKGVRTDSILPAINAALMGDSPSINSDHRNSVLMTIIAHNVMRMYLTSFSIWQR